MKPSFVVATLVFATLLASCSFRHGTENYASRQSDVCTCAHKGWIEGNVPLAPGEAVWIDSAHRSGMQQRLVIDSEGDILLPLMGRFHVAGLTAVQAAKEINRAYVDRGFYKEIEMVINRDFQ